MNNLSVWISLAALVISIGTLLHTILRSVSQTRLATVQKRSDLLTKIVELKLEYEQEANYLSWLTNVAHNHKVHGADELLKQTLEFKKFISQTQRLYDSLIRATSASKISLVEIEHHIDSLRVRVERESAILQKKKESIELLLTSESDRS